MSARAPRDGGVVVIAAGGGVGDALYATPVLRALRARYGRTTAIVLPGRLDAIDASVADAVLARPATLPAFARLLRAGRYAAGVVTWAHASAAYALLAAGVPERVGAARRLYSPLFTRRVVVRSELGDRRTHWGEIQLDFARALGADGSPVPVAPRDADGDAAAAALLARLGLAPGGYALLHPFRGVSAGRPEWPTSTFAALAATLRERFGTPLLVSGSATEREGAAGVARRAGAVAIAGETGVRAYAALAAGARYVVSMDSGPMHLAAAAGAPTLGLFAMAPDEPDRWRPLGRATAILRNDYPCPRGHAKETCPDFACVRALDPERVAAALAGLLERGGEGGTP